MSGIINSAGSRSGTIGTVTSGTIGNNVIFTDGILKASSTSYFRFLSGSDGTNTQGGGSPSGWYINCLKNYTDTADNSFVITYNTRCRHSSHYSQGVCGGTWSGSAHDPVVLSVHNGTYLAVTTILSGSTLQLSVENTYSGSLATNPLNYTLLIACNFDPT